MARHIFNEEAFNAGKRQFHDLCSKHRDLYESLSDGLFKQLISPSSVATAAKASLREYGCTGVDLVSPGQFLDNLGQYLHELRLEILTGAYKARGVRIVQIPKPSGGTRPISLLTIRDHITHGLVARAITPVVERSFHDSSMAYRPGRGPQTAIRKAYTHISEKFHTSIDVDIVKCFDCIDHQILLDRLSATIPEQNLVNLIANAMQLGVENQQGPSSARPRGLPQGSPLSPVLVNLYLNTIDQGLDSVGASFVRYCDDLVILARNRSDASKYFDKTNELMAQSRLEIHPDDNPIKSVWQMKYLGFKFVSRPDRSIKISITEDTVRNVQKNIQENLDISESRSIDTQIPDMDYKTSEIPLIRYLRSLPGSYGVSHDWAALKGLFRYAQSQVEGLGLAGFLNRGTFDKFKAHYVDVHRTQGPTEMSFSS